MSFANSLSQPEPQTTLITFQPAPRKTPSSSWMILPLPRTGPSSRCRLQLMTKIRLSRPLASAERDRAQRFRLVAFAVAEERPHLAVVGLREAAALEVLEEARLIDRHQRTEAHRHRRELPEVGHQPRMRIRGNALAFAFLAIVEELLLGQPALDEGARVDAGRHVALHVDQVAAVLVRRRVPEVAEADVVEQRRGLEARDVAAQLRRFLVRAQDDRHRVPADRRADLVLELAIAGRLCLLLRRDRVAVGRGRQERRHRAGAQRFVAQLAKQIPGALGSRMLQNRAQRVDPFLRFDRIVVVQDAHARAPRWMSFLVQRRTAMTPAQ